MMTILTRRRRRRRKQHPQQRKVCLVLLLPLPESAPQWQPTYPPSTGIPSNSQRDQCCSTCASVRRLPLLGLVSQIFPVAKICQNLGRKLLKWFSFGIILSAPHNYCGFCQTYQCRPAFAKMVTGCLWRPDTLPKVRPIWTKPNESGSGPQVF